MKAALQYQRSAILILAIAAYLAAVGESAFHVHAADTPFECSDQSCLICHVAKLKTLEPVVQGLPPVVESTQEYVPRLQSSLVLESLFSVHLTRAPPEKIVAHC
jgi:hypothetical protein